MKVLATLRAGTLGNGESRSEADCGYVDMQTKIHQHGSLPHRTCATMFTTATEYWRHTFDQGKDMRCSKKGMRDLRCYRASDLAFLLVAGVIIYLSLWRPSLWSSCGPEVYEREPSYLLLLPGNATSLPAPYPMQELPSEDMTTLIDIRDFDFRLNNFPCNDTDSLLLLVLVHSAPTNVENRRTIRETWGRFPEDGQVKVLFLLGSVDSPAEQQLLEDENREFHDIVQGSFRDAYRNMTYKHVMALKWTAYYCPNARYLLKTDDDVFVNSATLIDFLSQELSYLGARRLILCKTLSFMNVRRSFRAKWRVSPLDFAERVYPPYCEGWAVLYSPDVVFLLYREAQRAQYFWIDDLHLTGMLAARLKLTQMPLGSLSLTAAQVNTLISAPTSDIGTSISVFLFGPSNMQLSEIRKLWDAVQWRRNSAHGVTPPHRDVAS